MVPLTEKADNRISKLKAVGQTAFLFTHKKKYVIILVTICLFPNLIVERAVKM